MSVMSHICIAAAETQKISKSIYEDKDASKYVKPSLINKKQIITTKDGKEEITFIGTIKDKNEHVLFYILTMYSEVQAAIQVHGNSKIIYLDANKKLTKQYSLGGPEEFPFKLEKNALFFRYMDTTTNENKVYTNKVGSVPPKFMCVAPDDCY